MVIVASILMAFAIDAAWDARRERAEEARTVFGLEEEFRAYVETLEQSVAQSNVTLRRLGFLFSGSEDVPIDSLDAAFWELLYAPTWDRGSGARDALVASGQLELLRSEALRVSLAEWQGIKDELLDNQLSVRTYVLETLVPFLSAEGIPLARIVPYRFDPDVPIESRAAVGPRQRSAEVEAVYRRTISNPEFQALLSYRYFWDVSSSRKYREVLAAATRIHGLLVEEVGS